MSVTAHLRGRFWAADRSEVGGASIPIAIDSVEHSGICGYTDNKARIFGFGRNDRRCHRRPLIPRLLAVMKVPDQRPVFQTRSPIGSWLSGLLFNRRHWPGFSTAVDTRSWPARR
jgi:hypothetical protein